MTFLTRSKKDASLLVFPGGYREHVAVLETMPKGFSKWTIRVISREQLNPMRSTTDRRGPASGGIDHQGINSFVEFGEPGGCLYCYSAESKTHYYDQGQWRVLVTMIAN